MAVIPLNTARLPGTAHVLRWTVADMQPIPAWLKPSPRNPRPRCLACGGWLEWEGARKGYDEWSCINCGEPYRSPR